MTTNSPQIGNGTQVQVFVLPTNADRREAFKRVHLVESELIQASSDELELIESELIQASSDELELIGEMLDRPLPLRSYCAIDGGRPIDPPVALLMPIRLWEQDSSLFGDVNCGICRGRYLYTLRKQQHGLERAPIVRDSVAGKIHRSKSRVC